MLLNLFRLAHARIARRKEKILIDDRLEIDNQRHQEEQHRGDSEHFPVRAKWDQFIADPALHRFSVEFSRNCIAYRHCTHAILLNTPKSSLPGISSAPA